MLWAELKSELLTLYPMQFSVASRKSPVVLNKSPMVVRNSPPVLGISPTVLSALSGTIEQNIRYFRATMY
jgi:hypothetical protein